MGSKDDVGLMERMMRRSLLVAVAVVFGCGAHAFAGMNEFQSCRCGNGIATRGDSKAEVQQKCGKPVQTKSFFTSGCNEMWLYNFGPHEFMQGICFDRTNKVKKVLSLDRGY